MARRTLIDFFDDLAGIDREFLTYDDGYRSWSYTYREAADRARAFAARLDAAGIQKGHHVVIWSENRPEWIMALWGCLLRGVVLVPIDYRASPEFLQKVAGIVQARAVLVGEAVGDPGGAAPDDSNPPSGAARPVWALSSLAAGSTGGTLPPVEIAPDDTAEVIFTSGATSEPKGVVLTHRNILANILPIEREIAKYRRYARPFLPIRFLNLLPLSHMFGQAMATFVPPLLEGIVVFTRTYAPADVVAQIRRRRVSVLVCVPKMLEVLRDHVLRVVPAASQQPPVEGTHWLKRWWRYRRAHRLFGWKFWAAVVGAAPLDPEVEAFWGRLGFLVVQGYGLTETAPIVTLNHPFRASRGAVGRPIHGVEVRIAGDGEILVRGDNVTRGYFNAPEETQTAFRDGWFHTGDIGSFDDGGRLHIRGRKKEMIVTPEGLNVFPEDVERALNEQAGVRESAVVGATAAGGSAERVHAVVVLEPGADLDRAVRGANAALQDHQKIRAATPWTAGELPRTEGTRKLKRRELREWLLRGQQAASPGAATRGAEGRRERSVAAVLERFAPGRALTPDTTIDELGLSSLERVELMMALEEALQVTVDEARFSSAVTVQDLEEMTRPIDAAGSQGSRAAAPVVPAEPIDFPSWNRSAPARLLRRASLPTWILPAARIFTRVEVEGLEHLHQLTGPAVFAANHQSHLDTPAILMALPPKWRYRIAPAMAKEFFKAHFYPEGSSRKAFLTSSLNYYLASLFFNAFPLPQREAGTRQTLRYIGELVSAGYSVLIFPEGRRSDAGTVDRFLPGVGMIAAKLQVPVVPVRLDGLDRILHHTWKFPRRGVARVAFGAPLRMGGSDYAALARQVEEAVRSL